MDLISYEQIIKTENTARRYLLKFCWENHQRFCPKCRTRKLYNLAEKRKRCSRCGYTFHDFSRRFINVGNLECRQWLRLIKLFELEVSTRKIPEQLNISVNTAYKALNTIRISIISHAIDASLLFEHYGRDLGLPGIQVPQNSRDKEEISPVFGVFKKSGQLFIDFLPHLDESAVLHFKRNFYFKTAKLGNIVYTDNYKQYETLMFYEGLISKHYNVHHEDKGLAVDVNKGFWMEIKDRIRSIKGIMPHKLPLYLKEIEFRYNNKDKDLFELLARHICSFVPKFEKT